MRAGWKPAPTARPTVRYKQRCQTVFEGGLQGVFQASGELLDAGVSLVRFGTERPTEHLLETANHCPPDSLVQQGLAEDWKSRPGACPAVMSGGVPVIISWKTHPSA